MRPPAELSIGEKPQNQRNSTCRQTDEEALKLPLPSEPVAALGKMQIPRLYLGHFGTVSLGKLILLLAAQGRPIY